MQVAEYITVKEALGFGGIQFNVALVGSGQCWQNPKGLLRWPNPEMNKCVNFGQRKWILFEILQMAFWNGKSWRAFGFPTCGWLVVLLKICTFQKEDHLFDIFKYHSNKMSLWDRFRILKCMRPDLLYKEMRQLERILLIMSHIPLKIHLIHKI